MWDTSGRTHADVLVVPFKVEAEAQLAFGTLSITALAVQPALPDDIVVFLPLVPFSSLPELCGWWARCYKCEQGICSTMLPQQHSAVMVSQLGRNRSGHTWQWPRQQLSSTAAVAPPSCIFRSEASVSGCPFTTTLSLSLGRSKWYAARASRLSTCTSQGARSARH